MKLTKEKITNWFKKITLLIIAILFFLISVILRHFDFIDSANLAYLISIDLAIIWAIVNGIKHYFLFKKWMDFIELGNSKILKDLMIKKNHKYIEFSHSVVLLLSLILLFLGVYLILRGVVSLNELIHSFSSLSLILLFFFLFVFEVIIIGFISVLTGRSLILRIREEKYLLSYLKESLKNANLEMFEYILLIFLSKIELLGKPKYSIYNGFIAAEQARVYLTEFLTLKSLPLEIRKKYLEKVLILLQEARHNELPIVLNEIDAFLSKEYFTEYYSITNFLKQQYNLKEFNVAEFCKIASKSWHDKLKANLFYMIEKFPIFSQIVFLILFLIIVQFVTKKLGIEFDPVSALKAASNISPS